MRVLHFSDVHVGVALRNMKLTQWLSKRALGGVNLLVGRQHKFEAARAKLGLLGEFAGRQGVDLVIFTGDYTSLGLEIELSLARTVVEPLMHAPLGYVNVPGNHDVYVPEVIHHRRFERHFGDTLASDLPEYRVDGPWPLVRLLEGHVAVVAVNSARPNPLPWRSNGIIPGKQLESLRRVLADARIRDRWIFVATHYTARQKNGEPDRPLHGMVNADAFLDACAGIRRGAILSGHIHHCYRVQIEGVGPALYCAGSATMKGREGCWLFDIDGEAARATPVGWNGEGYETLPEGTEL